jgi:SLOG cluster2
MNNDGNPKDVLLKPDALGGIKISVSASHSPDLARVGLVETHFRLALAEIARSVLVSGGKLAYGGHLDPNGYTAMLIKELHRYSRRDRPLRISSLGRSIVN